MKIKGNGIAIGLGLLAVAIATTGTAYAVAATQVNIVDPTHSNFAAKVDSSGHLLSAGPTSRLAELINVSTPASGFYNYLTSPTKASLAITELQLGNPNPVGSDLNAHYATRLVKVGVNGSNVCDPSVSVTYLQAWDLAPESHIVAPYPAPLLVAPKASAAYCLAIFGYTLGNGTDSGAYFAYADFTGYVASGSYTGPGSPTATPAAPLRPKKK